MNWIELSDESQLNQILSKSAITPQVIFKHSTRCSISRMAKSRLERSPTPTSIDFNFLDLLQHRNISNNIEDVLDVEHQSPQILLIKNGKCVYTEGYLRQS